MKNENIVSTNEQILFLTKNKNIVLMIIKPGSF